MARKKIGYRWHLRRLMADRDMYPPPICGRCWPIEVWCRTGVPW
ncbi:hypothetical protein [Mycobacterium riyadhense]|nr:hypothetical protein [Mycobacterium riyadhense]